MLGTQEDIYNRIVRYYPHSTSLIVLPMDMEAMGAGRPELSASAQHDELRRLAAKIWYSIARPGQTGTASPASFRSPASIRAAPTRWNFCAIITNRVSGVSSSIPIWAIRRTTRG